MRDLIKIIRRFPKARILVIGDLILDEYIWGTVERISPEAPVPVIWASRHDYVPGGAANVAGNVRALGAQVLLVGVVGPDKNREVLFSQLRKRNIPTNAIFSESGRHTTVKTRIIAGQQQVARVDWEHTHALSRRMNAKILEFVQKIIGRFDAVIIEDYGKGVINKDLLRELIGLARSRKKIITVDPKEENFQLYRGVTAITPNRKEMENAIRNLKISDTTNRFKLNSDKLASTRDIDAASRQVLEYLELDSVLVTLGECGMQLFRKDGSVVNIPTVAQEVFDVSGAGDTVISVFTLAIACGATKLEAAHIANFAAGIVVGKLGTATTSREELIERISR